MNGYQTCRTLKADPRTRAIPVIFVTGLVEVGDESAGFAAGAVDYIAKPISPPIVRARVRTHLALVSAARLDRSYRDAIYMLAEAGHYNDHDTGAHVWRMAAYSRRLAEAAGWRPERTELLELAAPMHDTGKIGIPDAILKKPGKLDAAEWELMKTHSRIGHDILVRSDAPVFQLAAEVALGHHERWDGSGYPDARAGLDIPESGRIVAIADVYDALTARRPYKEPWPAQRAVATIIGGAGTHFDPRLVEAFTSILPDIDAIARLWSNRESALAFPHRISSR